MIAATGNQSHSKDLISMNRKLLNVVAIASLILPIRIAAADSLNARPCRWTITRTYVRGPGAPAGVVCWLPRWQSMPMPDYSLFGDEHVRRYEATGGKIGHDWNNTSCLVLHTIGRKSGETKKFPLIYGRDGNNYLIVASKGGAPDHPGWYKNLLAHPDVKIQVWDKVIPVRARTATAEEKKRVWPIMTAQWPDYDKYQAGTKRDIPVVLLTPR
jgi:deazaflavin-dependent oxidoreductase (nitroreductase family)